MAVALIVAAGSGERLGADRPKALVELGGRAMLEWSLESLTRVAAIERIVVALPPAHCSLPELARRGGGPDVLAVPGGAVRSASVRNALAAAGEGDPVLVHDAARPLVPVLLVEEVLAALDEPGLDGAIAAARVTDTIKQADGDRRVRETLDRETLWAVQTPQAFRREPLERALAVSEEVLAQATDDAWLIERSGGRIAVVPAPRENIKVTTTLDLLLAEALLQRTG